MTRLGPLALALSALACAGGNAPSTNPYSTATIPATPAPPALDASAPVAIDDAGPSSIERARADAIPTFAVARQPLPIVPIADRSRDAWPKKALPAGRHLGRGGVVLPGIPGPDRVAIATTDRRGLFVDARTGKVLAPLPAEPEYVSPRAGAVTLAGKPPRVLRAYDATLVTPALETREKLKTSWLAATPREDRIVALGETESGAKLAGLVTEDLTKAALYETPFGGNTKSFSATLNAREWQLTAQLGAMPFGEPGGTPYVLEHEEQCLRARIEKDGKPTCIEHTPKPGMGDGAHWLDDGWFSFGASVGHVAWSNRTLSIRPRGDSTMCVRRGSRATPPRIVVTCHGPSREAFVWAPDKVFAFQGPPDANDIGGLVGADIGYVLPVPEVVRPPNTDYERPTTKWIDLAGTRLLTSSPMVPLAVASFAGIEPVALGSSTENKVTSVWAIDFDAPARDLVGAIADCPGRLGELREDRAHGRRRYLILACMTPPPAHTVAQNLIWAEILDTEKKVRWRTSLMPELFFPDGVVVLSTRRAMSAESKTAPGELTSVDLTSLP